jgi:hypothetical protein
MAEPPQPTVKPALSRRIIASLKRSPAKWTAIGSTALVAVLAGSVVGFAISAGREPLVAGIEPGTLSDRAARATDRVAGATSSPGLEPTPSPPASGPMPETPAAPAPAESSTPPAIPSHSPVPTEHAEGSGTGGWAGHAHPDDYIPPHCDEVTPDADGTVLVNGVAVNPAYRSDHDRYSMRVAVLDLAAGASSTGGDQCLQVQFAPDFIVSGYVALCGEVISERWMPMETPVPDGFVAPRDDQPTVNGVVIPDRVLDVNSYPVLHAAAEAGVPACVHVTAASNDVWIDIPVSFCETALLHTDGSLSLLIGEDEVLLFPEEVYDPDAVLMLGRPTDVGLEIHTHMDDVVHWARMWISVVRDCQIGA